MKSKMIRDFRNYFLGDVFVKGFLFISLPLLSRIMDPQQYGKLSIINTAIMIMYVFVSLNLQNAVTNRYMLKSEGFNNYLKSIFSFLIPFQLFLICISPIIAKYMAVILGISESDFLWVMLICVLLSYIYIYTSYLQASRQSGVYVKINVLSKISEIILIFTFAYFMTREQYLSKIYAQLIISTIIIFFLFRKLKSISNGSFNSSELKDALYFSVPLIIHVLSNSLLSQADRIIINNMIGSGEAGIYSFAYNIAMGMVVLIMAWNSSWQPRLFKHIEMDSRKKITDTTKASAYLILAIGVIGIFFSKEVILLVADKNYYSSIEILPIIIIANAFTHLYLCYANFVFYKKRAFFISFATMLAMAINIGLNILLIPKYGIIGSAWATAFAYLMLTIFHYLTSTFLTKNNSISFIYIAIYLFVLMAAYYVSGVVDKSFTLWIAITIKIILTGLITAFLLKVNLLKKLSD
ncbi:oligosaccharide flippase family protein [Pantoea eucrina]|uniref:oligosaccharide flippase family protein n=1 Tax=Pantoea eucrina TaxID=472693 RepID=UPI00080F41DE|nr:oligosaccharide flippase family protein [Pantoea eucrina]